MLYLQTTSTCKWHPTIYWLRPVWNLELGELRTQRPRVQATEKTHQGSTNLCWLTCWWVWNPLKNMKVSWDDYSQYMETYKLFQSTNQSKYMLSLLSHPTPKDPEAFRKQSEWLQSNQNNLHTWFASFGMGCWPVLPCVFDEFHIGTLAFKGDVWFAKLLDNSDTNGLWYLFHVYIYIYIYTYKYIFI